MYTGPLYLNQTWPALPSITKILYCKFGGIYFQQFFALEQLQFQDDGASMFPLSTKWFGAFSTKSVGQKSVEVRILGKAHQVSEILLPDRKRGLQMSLHFRQLDTI